MHCLLNYSIDKQPLIMGRMGRLLKKLIQRIHRAHDHYRMKWRENLDFRVNRIVWACHALAFPRASATDGYREILDEVKKISEQLFWGFSVIMTSVVSIRPAAEAACWRAKRTTLVGLMPPVCMSFSH